MDKARQQALRKLREDPATFRVAYQELCRAGELEVACTVMQQGLQYENDDEAGVWGSSILRGDRVVLIRGPAAVSARQTHHQDQPHAYPPAASPSLLAAAGASLVDPDGFDARAEAARRLSTKADRGPVSIGTIGRVFWMHADRSRIGVSVDGDGDYYTYYVDRRQLEHVSRWDAVQDRLVDLKASQEIDCNLQHADIDARHTPSGLVGRVFRIRPGKNVVRAAPSFSYEHSLMGIRVENIAQPFVVWGRIPDFEIQHNAQF